MRQTRLIQRTQKDKIQMKRAVLDRIVGLRKKEKPKTETALQENQESPMSCHEAEAESLGRIELTGA
jgi:hypothetical protein